jgi:Tfp pilus assembly protein PilW
VLIARIIADRLRPARGEQGFTLIETLVAMVCGMIVMGALFAILEVSLHQSSRITDVTSATQAGRVTLTHIADELHSGCIASKFTPVKAGSSETKLILVNGYGPEAELAPGGAKAATTAEGVRKDEIEWVEEPKGNSLKEGVLRDKAFLATAGPGAEGEYTYSAKATPESGTVIGERVRQTETASKELVPIFRYYAYATKSSTSLSEASSTLQETPIKITGSLTAEQAKTVAAVSVSFRTLPPDKLSTITRTSGETGADLNTLVTFAFSAPSSEATITASPCE